jgi:acyl carrier protein
MNVRKLFEDAMLVCLYIPSTEYTDETAIKELGDSLDFVTVVAHIEDVSGVDIGKIDFSALLKVKDVIALLEQRINDSLSQPTPT